MGESLQWKERRKVLAKHVKTCGICKLSLDFSKRLVLCQVANAYFSGTDKVHH